jgi:hypothetical protein
MEKVVTKGSLKNQKSDIEYWLTRSETERLAAIEMLRQQYIKHHFGNAQPRLQRVCRIVK